LIILTLFAVLLSVILTIHASYPIILKSLQRFKAARFKSPHEGSDLGTPARKIKDEELPVVSVILPVYNEELVIERRLNNILTGGYPKVKLQVIVVDSGSTDNTSSIILKKFQDGVLLLREEYRQGKARAINSALNKCIGDIVIITDGPALYSRNTISHIVSCFEDPSVGGVSVLYKIPNGDESRSTIYEKTFWSYKDKLRVLEGALCSTSWLSGEACAFRNKTIYEVHQDTLADDSNIALQLISKNYRVIVNKNAQFTEKSPSQAKDYFKIKTRRALGGLLETLRFRSLLFNRRYGCFGSIIFPYRFFCQFISPIVSFIALGLALPAAIEIYGHLGIPNALIVIGTVSAVCFFFRQKIVAYVYMQLILMAALFAMLTRRVDVKWIQSQSTRL
jgi:cellulose synthase/poly-beta-1,6-N-acetylglucosamine synthase-like glycosyltransferase